MIASSSFSFETQKGCVKNVRFVETLSSLQKVVPLHCICTIFPNWKLKIKVPFDHHKISWPWLNVFPLKIYQNVKKSNSFSKIVNNNAKLFIYTTTIEAHLFAEKWIYIALSQPLDILLHFERNLQHKFFEKLSKTKALLC